MNPFDQLGETIKKLAEASTEEDLFKVALDEGLDPSDLEEVIPTFSEEDQPKLREALKEYEKAWRKRGV